jgi:hypothetical protein
MPRTPDRLLWAKVAAAELLFLPVIACTPDSKPNPLPTLVPLPERPALVPSIDIPRGIIGIPEQVESLIKNPRLELWRQSQIENGATEIIINYWPLARTAENRLNYGGYDFLHPEGAVRRFSPFVLPDNLSGAISGSFAPGIAVSFSFESYRNGEITEAWALWNATPTIDSTTNIPYMDGSFMSIHYQDEPIMELDPISTRGNWEKFLWTGPLETKRIISQTTLSSNR